MTRTDDFLNSFREDLVNELRFPKRDFSAPVVAAEVVSNGVPQDRVFFKNLSLFKRFVSTDIERAEVLELENEDNKLVFEINREGLYDMLPESIFHDNAITGTQANVADEFAMRRQEEKNARSFFNPLENEFLHTELRLEIAERELYSNQSFDANRNLFEYLFSKSNFLTNVQVASLLYILPLTNKIRGNVLLVSEAMTKVLDYHVEVEERRNSKVYYDDAGITHTLGALELGTTFVCGTQPWVYQTIYNISVHNVQQTAFPSFKNNGRNRAILNFLIPYFFPVQSKINIGIKARADEQAFVCTEVEKVCYLGFNTYI